MEQAVFPTKGNLIAAKKTLAFSRQGYELLDKKRNILIREMMDMMDTAKEVQSQIDTTFQEAYQALQSASIMTGIDTIEQVGFSKDPVDNLTIRHRSVMGVDIPIVLTHEEDSAPEYGLYRTSVSLDEAYQKFEKVKQLTIRLAEIETSIYRLAVNIKKTQKRANALKNISIPRYEHITKSIADTLEEKDREEFTRLKVIKNFKEKE